MGRYVIRRLVLVPLVLLGMTFVTFIASEFVPTDPVAAFLGSRYEGGANPEKAIALVKHQWGFDKPITTRYVIYLDHLIHGNFGISSSSRRPVIQDLREYAPATFELVIATMLIALVIAVPLGVAVGSRRPGGVIDSSYKALSVVVVSAPPFWLALIAVDVFYRRLGWAAGAGRLSVFTNPPPHRTGLYVVDSILAGQWSTLRDAVDHLVLPAGLLGCIMGIYFARVLADEISAALRSDYIRTARGKGLSSRTILYRHALKNAIVPVVTLSGLAFGILLTSTIVIENVFGWPGLGNYAYRAASQLDLPGIGGVTLIVGLAYLLVNLIVDVLYAVIDPRVRLQGGSG